MPHAEIKYSSDLSIDAGKILRVIEERINLIDPGAGACKGRAYPAEVFHHSHILIEVSMLTKAHRGGDFTMRVRDDLELAIKQCLRQPCYFSLAINYSDEFYVTNTFVPEG